MLFVIVLACGACRTRAVSAPPVVATQPPLPAPPPAPPPRGIEAEFQSVLMANETVGWAINSWEDVSRTEDGGETFRSTQGSFKTHGEGSEESLVVGSDRVAWVLEEPRGFEEGYRPSAWIHRTSDGGKTWSTTTISTQFGGRTTKVTASLADEKVGFVTVMGEFDSELPKQLVYRTTDGGKSFAFVGKSQSLDTIAARSESIAMAPQDSMMVGNGNQVFRTTNGGRTWDSIRVPSLSRTDVGNGGPISFFGPDHGFAAMLGTSAENKVVLYRSDDAGASWRIDATLDGVDLCSGHVSAYGAFAAVRSGKQHLYRSFRHGIWDDIGELPGECDHRLQVIDDHVLYVMPVAGHRGMWRSRDGGRHWTEIGRKVGY